MNKPKYEKIRNEVMTLAIKHGAIDFHMYGDKGRYQVELFLTKLSSLLNATLLVNVQVTELEIGDLEMHLETCCRENRMRK